MIKQGCFINRRDCVRWHECVFLVRRHFDDVGNVTINLCPIANNQAVAVDADKTVLIDDTQGNSIYFFGKR